ncbi:MAG: zinc-dependent peptidase [Chromatiales bacterium]|nr:zinc-dependent peptidase [Chromatiales bacterium]
MKWLRERRRRRILSSFNWSQQAWDEVVPELAVLDPLPARDLIRLRDLATLFVHEKDLYGVRGLELTEPMQLAIALQACLPILALGMDWYRGWHSVVVYPEGFWSPREHIDEAGVLHEELRPLIGEAWESGPVILSWADVLGSGERDGENLVIHEFAHKLDMADGVVNGMPPLHKGLSRQAWIDDFTAAYDDLCERVDRDEPTGIDPYASEAPDEFFAVVSEAFFEIPEILNLAYPQVYRHLRDFYRLDPLAWAA